MPTSRLPTSGPPQPLPAASGDRFNVQNGQQREGVVDQRGDQLVAGGLVVPRDRRLPGAGVVLPGQRGQPRARRRDQVLGAHDVASHATDRGDQLGHRVLGGHRVVKDRGVERAALLPGYRAGLDDDLSRDLEDPMRPLAGRQPAPPIGQHRRVERPSIEREPTRCLPPAGSVFAFLAEHRQRLFPAEGFEDLFPSGRGRPSIPPDVVATVLVLQTLHNLSDREAADAVTFDLRKEMPSYRLDIEHITLTIRASLHESSISGPQPTGRRCADCSALS
jgi:hypothetical protein